MPHCNTPNSKRIHGNNWIYTTLSPSCMVMCINAVVLHKMLHASQTFHRFEVMIRSLKENKSMNLLFQCHRCVRDGDLRGNDTHRHENVTLNTPEKPHPHPVSHLYNICCMYVSYLHFYLCIFFVFLHKALLSSHSDEIYPGWSFNERPHFHQYISFST